MTPEESTLRKDIQTRLESLMTRYGWGLKDQTIPKASRSSWTGETRLSYRLFLALRQVALDEDIPVSHIHEEVQGGKVTRVIPRRKCIVRNPVYLYFSHEAGNTDLWKIGCSENPPQRVRDQTFNPREIVHEFAIGDPWLYEDGKGIEAAVLLFTESRRSKGKGTREWRNLSASYIHDLSEIVEFLATEIASQGLTALTSRYIRPKKRGVCPAKVEPRR